MPKHAYGFCDRTGFRYPIDELVPQYIDRRPSGLLVGSDMLDIDHEQLQLGDLDLKEDISLPDPRPDTTLGESRAMSAWNPVGGGVTVFGSRTGGLDMTMVTGRVSIT